MLYLYYSVSLSISIYIYIFQIFFETWELESHPKAKLVVHSSNDNYTSDNNTNDHTIRVYLKGVARMENTLDSERRKIEQRLAKNE